MAFATASAAVLEIELQDQHQVIGLSITATHTSSKARLVNGRSKLFLQLAVAATTKFDILMQRQQVQLALLMQSCLFMMPEEILSVTTQCLRQLTPL